MLQLLPATGSANRGTSLSVYPCHAHASSLRLVNYWDWTERCTTSQPFINSPFPSDHPSSLISSLLLTHLSPPPSLLIIFIVILPVQFLFFLVDLVPLLHPLHPLCGVAGNWPSFISLCVVHLFRPRHFVPVHIYCSAVIVYYWGCQKVCTDPQRRRASFSTATCSQPDRISIFHSQSSAFEQSNIWNRSKTAPIFPLYTKSMTSIFFADPTSNMSGRSALPILDNVNPQGRPQIPECIPIPQAEKSSETHSLVPGLTIELRSLLYQ